jgi:3-oxo-5alpha-steroid 4-dehydrogenase
MKKQEAEATAAASQGVKVSRRDFLKQSLVASAGMAGMAGVGLLSGCAPKTSGDGSQENTSISAADVNWDKETEVLIVGFGAAGSAAAIEAQEAGAKVTIIEMASSGGGCAVINGGFIYLGGGTPTQKQLGIEDSAENMYSYYLAAVGQNASQEAVKLICDDSLATYDFCMKLGIKFDGVLDDGHVSYGREGLALCYTGNEKARAYRSLATPVPRGHVAGPGGVIGFAPMVSYVEGAGVEIIYDTEVTQLIQDENARVVGVKARSGSETVYVKATKAVVLAGGGFTGNAEMVWGDTNLIHRAGVAIQGPNEYGQTIKLGQSIGADVAQMGNPMLGFTVYALGADACKGILVSQSGRRFIAEDEYGAWVGEKIMQLGPTTYMLFDAALKASYDKGFEGQSESDRGAALTPLASGDTVAEVAAAAGIDPVVLENTVSFYNLCAEKAEDPEYGKEDVYVVPLSTPPYYIFGAGTESCYYESQGGLKIDIDTHVLDVNGEPIPALYAVGRCTGGLTYGHYPASGSSMADCFTFGRIAGRKAAAETA